LVNFLELDKNDYSFDYNRQIMVYYYLIVVILWRISDWCYAKKDCEVVKSWIVQY